MSWVDTSRSYKISPSPPLVKGGVVGLEGGKDGSDQTMVG
jgi:hypothetical protein